MRQLQVFDRNLMDSIHHIVLSPCLLQGRTRRAEAKEGCVLSFLSTALVVINNPPSSFLIVIPFTFEEK